MARTGDVAHGAPDGRLHRNVGVEPRPEAALEEHLEHPLGGLRFEPLLKFRLHALGNERVGFPRVDHAAHERHRLGGHREFREARRKARAPENAHRVLGKRFAHVPEHASSQISGAAVGVGEVPVRIHRDRVDREIAPTEVVFERHVGRGVKDEPVVAGRGFALRARERVLLMGLRVKEDRKVAAHGLEPAAHHRLGRLAQNDPVAVLGTHGEAFFFEETVADPAADDVALHGSSDLDAEAGSTRPRSLVKLFTGWSVRME